MSDKEKWYDTYDIMYEHFKEMQEKSADYSQGYRAGWNDCYKMFRELVLSKKEEKKLDPDKQHEEYKKVVKDLNDYYHRQYPPPYNTQPWQNVIRNCPTCGLQLTDTLGRPIPLGYVCNNLNCPTFPKVSYTYGIGTGNVPSVVYAAPATNYGANTIVTNGTVWISNNNTRS